MARYIQLIAGSLLFVGFILFLYMNVSLYAGRPSLSVQLILYRVSTGGFFIPWGPWFGLVTTVCSGMFLFASISPKH